VHVAVPSLARLVSPRPKINTNLGTMASSARLLSKPYRKDELARILREAFDARTCPKPSGTYNGVKPGSNARPQVRPQLQANRMRTNARERDENP
jgi:hypothetical protein